MMNLSGLTVQPGKWITLKMGDNGYRFVRPEAITEIAVSFESDSTGEKSEDWEVIIAGEGYCIESGLAQAILSGEKPGS